MRKIFATIFVFLGLFAVSAAPALAQYNYMPAGYGWAQPGSYGTYGFGYSRACCLSYAWHNPQEVMLYQPMYYPAPMPPYWGLQQPYGNYYGGNYGYNQGGFINIGFGW